MPEPPGDASHALQAARSKRDASHAARVDAQRAAARLQAAVDEARAQVRLVVTRCRELALRAQLRRLLRSSPRALRRCASRPTCGACRCPAATRR
jgi:hypothetical protein